MDGSMDLGPDLTPEDFFTAAWATELRDALVDAYGPRPGSREEILVARAGMNRGSIAWGPAASAQTVWTDILGKAWVTERLDDLLSLILDDEAVLKHREVIESTWQARPPEHAPRHGLAALFALAGRKRREPATYGLTSAGTLIGHGRELAQVQRRLGAVKEEGRGRLVVLDAPRGYGRFALAQRLLESAWQDGATVLAAGFGAPAELAARPGLRSIQTRWTDTYSQACPAWAELLLQAQTRLGAGADGLPIATGATPPHPLNAALRSLALQGPLVILLDEVDCPSAMQRQWWQSWLLDFSTAMHSERLPVLLVLTQGLPLNETLEGAFGMNEALALLDADLCLRLPLREVDQEDARAFLEQRLGGPAPVLDRSLCRLAEGVPAVMENLLDWWLRGLRSEDGTLRPMLERDGATGRWRATVEAVEMVHGEMTDAVLETLDACLRRGGNGGYYPEAKRKLGEPSLTDIAVRERLKLALGLAALEGPRFTAEVVAETMGLDPDDFIDLLDDCLSPEDEGGGVLEGDGYTVLSQKLLTQPLPAPAAGGAAPGAIGYLHHYRFVWPWQWLAWRKLAAANPRDRAGLTLQTIATMEAVVPELQRYVVAPALARLMLGKDGAKAAQDQRLLLDVPPANWLARAEPYLEFARYYADPAQGLQELRWHAARMEKHAQAQPHHIAMHAEVRLALARLLLKAVASGWEEKPLEVVEQAAHAAILARSLGDAERLARATALEQAGHLAEALLASGNAASADALSAFLAAGLADAAHAARLDASLLPKEQAAVMPDLLLKIMQTPAVSLPARISAGLTLGRLGSDPRFERHVGPDGPYLLPPMVTVPAGDYLIGSSDDKTSDAYDPDGQARERPPHRVRMAAYQIARYPVTNAEWQCFMEAKGYEDERWWQSEAARHWLAGDPERAEEGRNWWRNWWQEANSAPDREAWLAADALRRGLSKGQRANDRGIAQMSRLQLEQLIRSPRWYPDRPAHEPNFWRDSRFNNPAQPVVGVSWFEAQAYCAWLSHQTGLTWSLPSEPEWEAAARGLEGRRYAFGADFDPDRANTAESGVEATTPVGIYPQGATPEPAVIHDLCGNVWEWTRSLWGAFDSVSGVGYPYEPGDGREDPETPLGAARVVRGGSWFSVHHDARAAFRSWDLPFSRYLLQGFRLVVSSPISPDALASGAA